MSKISPELRAAIDTAKQRVKVETYYPKAMNSGLKGNAQGFWGGTVLGFLTGGLSGGALSASLLLAGIASPLIGWPLIIGLAGMGGTMGGGIGARIGAGSGAIAGVAAERERRDRAEKLEQDILASPDKQREVIAAYRDNPVLEKNDTLEEIFATSASTGKAVKKLLDPTTFAVVVGLCALAGMALFAGSFVLAGGAAAVAAGAPISSGLGALGMTSLGSALAIGAGTGSAMGAAFGIAYPPIFASLTNKTADFLSQKTMHGKTQFSPVKTAEEMQREAVQNQAASVAQEIKTEAPRLALAATNKPSSHIHEAALVGRLATEGQQLAV